MDRFDLQQGPDALALHLTGAATAGGVQPDPAASLGGHRSATRLAGQGRLVESGTGMRTLRVIEAHGESGVGTLRAVTAGSVRWRSPGGGEGPSVTVDVGATRIVPADPAGDYLVVHRAAAGPLAGAMRVRVVDRLHTLFDDRPAGSGGVLERTRYRAVMIRARQDLANLRIWVSQSAPSHLRIGLESPKASGAIQKIADQFIAPGGVPFSNAATESAALTIASLAKSAGHGLWLAHAWTENQTAVASASFALAIRFDAPLYSP